MKKQKIQKYENEETKEIKSLIIITISVIIIALGMYFLTDKVLSKKNEKETIAEFNYSICTIGTMFNRPYEEYYVFIYDSKDEKASAYAKLTADYETKDEALKIYTADLNNKFNSSFISDSSNPKPTNPTEVKIKNSALVHIKNGKVINYYETSDDYEKVLK